MQGLTQPELLLKPFAQSGTKNTIPVTNTDSSNPQKADLTNGFPAITSLEPDDGGLPPERADFNGLGYLTTTYDYFAQAGGKYTFNQTVSTAIGGYPLGARLWYFDGNDTYILRSTKNNNDDNFITNPSFIGSSWVKDTPTMSDLINRVPPNVGSPTNPVYTNSSGVITACTPGVFLGIPDYTQTQSVSSTPFTAQKNGIFYYTVNENAGGGTVSAYVNDKFITSAYSYGAKPSESIILGAGDTLRLQISNASTSNMTFTPFKGS